MYCHNCETYSLHTTKDGGCISCSLKIEEKKALQGETVCVRMTKPISPNTHDSKKMKPPKSYLRDV